MTLMVAVAVRAGDREPIRVQADMLRGWVRRAEIDGGCASV